MINTHKYVNAKGDEVECFIKDIRKNGQILVENKNRCQVLLNPEDLELIKIDLKRIKYSDDEDYTEEELRSMIKSRDLIIGILKTKIKLQKNDHKHN